MEQLCQSGSPASWVVLRQAWFQAQSDSGPALSTLWWTERRQRSVISGDRQIDGLHSMHTAQTRQSPSAPLRFCTSALPMPHLCVCMLCHMVTPINCDDY
jgi:hypothetical protein